MKFTLEVKPLSVNRAWQGRRFSTPEKKQYEKTLAMLLPKATLPGPYYRIDYKFYLVQFKMTDSSNLLKCLTDCIVRRGIIKDDRYIIEEHIRKYPATKDRIEIRIESIELHAESALF